MGTVYCQMSSQKRNVINKREMGIEGDKTWNERWGKKTHCRWGFHNGSIPNPVDQPAAHWFIFPKADSTLQKHLIFYSRLV